MMHYIMAVYGISSNVAVKFGTSRNCGGKTSARDRKWAGLRSTSYPVGELRVTAYELKHSHHLRCEGKWL